jgi:hypothetical protein
MEEGDEKSYFDGLNFSHTCKLLKTYDQSSKRVAEMLDYAAQAFVCELVNKASLKPSKKKLTEADIVKACKALGFESLVETANKVFDIPKEEKSVKRKKD